MTNIHSFDSEGTFDADNAVGTATTVSSEVPIQTSTIAGDLKAIKAGNQNLVADVASSTMPTSAKAQGTAIQAGNKLAVVGPAPTASDSECEVEMVTVTVTVTAKPNASKRHLARRSRQHMAANFD